MEPILIPSVRAGEVGFIPASLLLGMLTKRLSKSKLELF
jgi:hypothetical protein